MAGTACTAPTGSAPPTHAESELAEEPGESGGGGRPLVAWTCPCRRRVGLDSAEAASWPAKGERHQLGAGSLCPVWSVEG